MPKLADAIRRSQRVETAPIGFGAARPAPKPSMLVGFLAPPSMVAAARDAGADLIIIEANVASAAAAKLRTEAGDLPLGVHPNSIDAGTAKALQGAGIDFLVFDADSTPAAALLEEDLGYVVRLPEAPSEDFLRALDSLSLEAIGMQPLSGPFTVAAQMEVGRVATLGRKPLLCPVAADASKEDLQCLRAAGIAVVLVSGAPADVTRLKQTVASLPPRRVHRDEQRTVVSLPRGNAAAAEEDDDDDDDALGS